MQKFSIQSGAYAYLTNCNIRNKFIVKKVDKNLIFLVKSIDFGAAPMVEYILPEGAQAQTKDKYVGKTAVRR